jgi:hypothetical protein
MQSTQNLDFHRFLTQPKVGCLTRYGRKVNWIPCENLAGEAADVRIHFKKCNPLIKSLLSVENSNQCENPAHMAIINFLDCAMYGHVQGPRHLMSHCAEVCLPFTWLLFLPADPDHWLYEEIGYYFGF